LVWQAVKITADTNLLVRALTCDDARQSAIACDVLAKAEGVALTLPALCELVWVLSQGYGVQSAEIARAIRQLVESENVIVNRPAVEAGLDMLERGGDFADGIIAYEGKWFGAEKFVSFDRKAVTRLRAAGMNATDLG
jgi:predicted nucleic-acid-binding protein